MQDTTHNPVHDIMTTEEVTSWIRVPQSTLCRWRQVGKGPRVTWLSETCPRDQRTDVEVWLERAMA